MPEFPFTAQEYREQAETFVWLSMRTDGHEGTEDREKYRAWARKCLACALELELTLRAA